MEWNGRRVKRRKKRTHKHTLAIQRENKKCGARTCLKVDFGWHIDYALSHHPKKKTLNHHQQRWTIDKQFQATTTKKKQQIKNQQNTKLNTLTFGGFTSRTKQRQKIVEFSTNFCESTTTFFGCWKICSVPLATTGHNALNNEIDRERYRKRILNKSPKEKSWNFCTFFFTLTAAEAERQQHYLK